MEGDKRKEGRRGQRMGEEGKGREKREKEGIRGKRKGEEGKGREKREKERERVEYFGTREVGPNPSRMFIV